MEENKQKEIIKYFLKKEILLSKGFINSIPEDFKPEEIIKTILQTRNSNTFLILTSDILKMIDKESKLDINWFDFDKAKVLLEKGENKNLYFKFIEFLDSEDITQTSKYPVNIIFSYKIIYYLIFYLFISYFKLKSIYFYIMLFYYIN